jgi:hypothetical protein
MSEPFRLERRGFVVKQVAGVGEAYYFIDAFQSGSSAEQRS